MLAGAAARLWTENEIMAEAAIDYVIHTVVHRGRQRQKQTFEGL
jgi:hypothetical protein